MIVAKLIQAMGCLALAAAAVLLVDARVPIPGAIPFAEPVRRWNWAGVELAVQAALGGLILLGIGGGLADLRTIRERLDRAPHQRET